MTQKIINGIFRVSRVILVYCAIIFPIGAHATDIKDLLSRADSLIALKKADSAAALGNEILKIIDKKDDSLTAHILHKIAGYNDQAMKFDAAESLYIASYQIEKKIYKEPNLLIAKSELSLGDIYNKRGRNEKADSLFRRGISALTVLLGESDTLTLKAQRHYAQNLKNWGMLDSSMICYGNILNIFRNKYGPNDPKLISAYWDYSISLYHAGQIASGGQFVDSAINISRTALGDTSFTLTRMLYNKSFFKANEGDIKGAASIIKTAIERLKKYNPSKLDYLGFLTKALAIYNNILGEYEQAEKNYLEAIDLSKKNEGEISHNYAQGKIALAEFYTKLGRLSEAEQLYKDAIDLIGKVFWYNKNPDYAVSPMIQLANLYMMLGRNYEAERLFLKAVSVRETNYGENSKLAECYFYLAQAYREQGKLDEGLDVCNKAVDIYLKKFGADNYETNQAQLCLASIFAAAGNSSVAESLYTSVCETRSRVFGPEHYYTAAVLYDMADFYYKARKYQKAEELAGKALDIYLAQFGDDHQSTARLLTLEGAVHAKLGDISQSIEYYSKALAIYRRWFDLAHPEINKITLALARIYVSIGAYHKALQYYEQFIESRRRLINYLFISSSEEQKLRGIQKYPSIENSLLWATQVGGGRIFDSLAFEMIINGKASVVDAVLQEKNAIMCSNNKSKINDLENLSQVCNAIANISSRIIQYNLPFDHADTLQQLFIFRDSLENQVSEDCSNMRAILNTKNVSLDDVIAVLPDSTALLEITKCSPFAFDLSGAGADSSHAGYMSLLLDADGNISINYLGNAEEIDELIKLVRQYMYDASGLAEPYYLQRNEIELKKILSALYGKIIGPVEDRINDFSRLIISPDGLLNLIPFEILVGKDSSYLVEKYDISYVSSGRDICSANIHKSHLQGSVVLFADPDFDSINSQSVSKISTASDLSRYSVDPDHCLSLHYNRLGDTRTEADSIKLLIEQESDFAVHAYYDSLASEVNLKNMNTIPAILHIATHGYFCNTENEDILGEFTAPMVRSGFVLSGGEQPANSAPERGQMPEDGIVTALEIAGMDLTGNDLTVVSACKSGVGEPITSEGVFGLRRAFQHAGAGDLLLTLWDVPDYESSRLMIAFYKKLINGLPAYKALRNAKLDKIHYLKKSQGHSHPLLWGGYIITQN